MSSVPWQTSRSARAAKATSTWRNLKEKTQVASGGENGDEFFMEHGWNSGLMEFDVKIDTDEILV